MFERITRSPKAFSMLVMVFAAFSWMIALFTASYVASVLEIPLLMDVLNFLGYPFIIALMTGFGLVVGILSIAMAMGLFWLALQGKLRVVNG